MHKGDIVKRSRNNNQSKAGKVFAYTCNRIYNFPVIQIANYFNISSPAVSNMISEGEKLIKLPVNT